MKSINSCSNNNNSNSRGIHCLNKLIDFSPHHATTSIAINQKFENLGPWNWKVSILREWVSEQNCERIAAKMQFETFDVFAALDAINFIDIDCP